jgi:ribonuclease HII
MRVAGVDEVGRGPLAGPVYAGAVVLPSSRPRWISQLNDSKVLEAAAREELSRHILARCDWGIGAVSQQVIDQIGIVKATRLAMKLAVSQLREVPDALIVDGREVVAGPVEQRAVIDADALSKSVAAASIIAKVARDAHMCDLDQLFPGYGLARNKGYSSREHLDALARLGYSTVHRLTFAPVRAALRGRSAANDALAVTSK